MAPELTPLATGPMRPTKQPRLPSAPRRLVRCTSRGTIPRRGSAPALPASAVSDVCGDSTAAWGRLGTVTRTRRRCRLHIEHTCIRLLSMIGPPSRTVGGCLSAGEAVDRASRSGTTCHTSFPYRTSKTARYVWHQPQYPPALATDVVAAEVCGARACRPPDGCRWRWLSPALIHRPVPSPPRTPASAQG